MLGITSLQAMFNPMATLEHGRMTAAATMNAQNRPTDLTKEAQELMSHDKTLNFADAYKIASKAHGAGAEISAAERLQAKYMDSLEKIKARYPMLAYADPNKKDPKLEVARINYQNEVKQLQDQMKAEGGGATGLPVNNPPPNTNSDLPPPATNLFTVTPRN
jgi:hypothetical protein